MKSESITRELPLSSNIFSGLYTLTELLLVTLVTHLLTVALGAYHLKKIYHERTTISLRPPPWHVVVSFGATTKAAHIIATAVALLTIILLAVGDFAIVGESEPDYSEVPAKVLVRRAKSDEVFNFRDHISFEKEQVSGEVLLIYATRHCYGQSPVERWNYELVYTGNEQNIHTLMLPAQASVPFKCITRRRGFRPRSSVRHEKVRKPPFPTTCELSPLGLDMVPFRRLVQLVMHVSASCPFQIPEMWCFLNKQIDCAFRIVYTNGEVAGIYSWSQTRPARASFGSFRFDNLLNKTQLQSMVLLMGARMGENPTELALMSLMTVDSQAHIEKELPERDITKVNTILLGFTVGPAAAIIVLTGFATLFLWLKYEALPGRRCYNRFNSPMDLLSCAAYEANKDGGSRFRRRKVLVGLKQSQSHNELIIFRVSAESGTRSVGEDVEG